MYKDCEQIKSNKVLLDAPCSGLCVLLKDMKELINKVNKSLVAPFIAVTAAFLFNRPSVCNPAAVLVKASAPWRCQILYFSHTDSIYHLSFASVLPKLIANLNAMKDKYLKAPHPDSLYSDISEETARERTSCINKKDRFRHTMKWCSSIIIFVVPARLKLKLFLKLPWNYKERC
ncbi:hypothetical protein P8452_02077 [Trifolium repens]|nr:hypothetical protein P8452_02077 [Trifolium repens]